MSILQAALKVYDGTDPPKGNGNYMVYAVIVVVSTVSLLLTAREQRTILRKVILVTATVLFVLLGVLLRKILNTPVTYACQKVENACSSFYVDYFTKTKEAGLSKQDAIQALVMEGVYYSLITMAIVAVVSILKASTGRLLPH